MSDYLVWCKGTRSDGTDCVFEAKTERCDMPLCLTHANVFDGWVELIGADVALTRITKGRDACGDLVAIAIARLTEVTR